MKIFAVVALVALVSLTTAQNQQSFKDPALNGRLPPVAEEAPALVDCTETDRNEPCPNCEGATGNPCDFDGGSGFCTVLLAGTSFCSPDARDCTTSTNSGTCDNCVGHGGQSCIFNTGVGSCGGSGSSSGCSDF
eukprot:m.484908 g.484908  ORF g.484908 m.484908 type:complete len:134 (-) comp23583_c0_seq1:70-471(-)